MRSPQTSQQLPLLRLLAVKGNVRIIKHHLYAGLRTARMLQVKYYNTAIAVICFMFDNRFVIANEHYNMFTVK